MVLISTAHLIAAACSSPISDAPGPGPDAGLDAIAADSSFGQSPCAVCLNGACAAERVVCAGDPGCAAHLDCLGSCPSDPGGGVLASCGADCPIPESALGRDALTELLGCIEEHSLTSCAACANADAGGGCAHPLLCQQCAPSSFPEECGKCWFENCCDTFETCDDQPECVAIESCFNGCVGSVSWCFTQCFTAHPEFVPEFLRDHACFSHFCSESCSGPSGLDEKCQACIDGPCVASRLDCESDAGCFVLMTCIGECGDDSPCVEGCYDAASAPSLELFEAHHVCKVLKCNDACR